MRVITFLKQCPPALDFPWNYLKQQGIQHPHVINLSCVLTEENPKDIYVSPAQDEP